MRREVRIPGLRRVMHLGGGGGAVEREIEEELGFHLETRRDALIAQGVAPSDALRIAREEFGSVSAARQELANVDRRRRANARRADWREALAQDTRLALRRMRATPGLTLAIVMTLALGIGTNAAMFQIADRLLFEPPSGVASPNRLATVVLHLYSPFDHTVGAGGNWNFPSFNALASAPGIDGIALHDRTHISVAMGSAAWRAYVELVSPNYFAILGARPERGRLFSAAADSSAATPGVVISDQLWRTRLGQDPNAIGRIVRIGRFAYPVVGIASPGFTGAGLETVDCWLPATEAVNIGIVPKDWRTSNAYWLSAVVRLSRVASMQAAESQLTAALRRWIAADPNNPFAGQVKDTLSYVQLQPLGGMRDDKATRSPAARVAGWLAILSTLVLLIACANVAGLLFVRSLQRSREFALRRALGMSRARLLMQLFVESSLIALLGGAVAIVALHWTTPVLRDVVAPHVLWGGLSARSDVLIALSTIVGVLITALPSAVLPTRMLSRSDAGAELKPMGHTAPVGRSRTQALLVGAQIAICVVLLAVAGVFVQSLRRVRSLDYGLNLDLIVAELKLPTTTTGAAADRLRRAVAAVEAVPGVKAVAVADASPFYSMKGGGLSMPGRPRATLPQTSTGGPYATDVSPGYFAATGTRIEQGRAFVPSDTVAGAAPVLIISESIARLYWPGANPVGQCAYVDGSATKGCTTVIGVAHDQLRMFVTEDPRLEIFLPLAGTAGTSPNMTLVIRATNPSSALPMLQRALQQLDPSAPFADIGTLRSRLDPQTQSWLLGATMMSGFGLLALLLAAVGLYGVMAYTIASRTHEIGVRIAVGASRANVVTLFVGKGLRIVAAGIVIGGAVSLLVLRKLADLLFHTAPTDPASLAAAVCVLLGAALVASLIPARRAASIDPLEALRQE